MLTETLIGNAAPAQPDYERIAAYHRRPLAARYAVLLKDLVAKASAKPETSSPRREGK